MQTNIESNLSDFQKSDGSSNKTIFLLVGSLILIFILLLLIFGLINNSKKQATDNLSIDNKGSTAISLDIKTSPAVINTLPNKETSSAQTTNIKVTPTSITLKKLSGINYDYSFNFPNSWNFVELLSNPTGEDKSKITGEDGYIVSGNKNMIFSWNMNGKGSDGGEVKETIKVGNLNIPFFVNKQNGFTIYSFSGKDTALGVDLPRIENVRIVMEIKDGENIQTGKEVLQLIISTLKPTK